MKKLFIGSLIFTVFLYVTMTDQVWSAMESWQHALWVLFMFSGLFTLFVVPYLYFSGYRPRNLKKEIEELNERVSFLKRELVIKGQERHDLVLNLEELTEAAQGIVHPRNFYQSTVLGNVVGLHNTLDRIGSRDTGRWRRWIESGRIST
tara:strand:+ start:197 stop:643 length:447 start_codon:yes stop_codon:yes gene_type:complete